MVVLEKWWIIISYYLFLNRGVIMYSEENSTGKPLANSNWLLNHHRAKIPERTAFAKKLAKLHPTKIVDLGCATGLWLNILNEIISPDCEFIGIDSDLESLEVAIARSKTWSRKTSFMKLDIEKEVELIPSADLILAFNIFPYINDLDTFLYKLAAKTPRGTLAVRQYDGASIRFGPMPTSIRQKIEQDLQVATGNSEKFRHYDMDRTFTALQNSAYDNIKYNFELFERTSPFEQEFIPYYEGTMSWTCQHISDFAADFLRQWMNDDKYLKNRYFFEVDLVALLS